MDVTKLKPLNDRVIVKRVELMTGSIYIPDAYKEHSCHGQVVAVGPGRRKDNGEREEMQVKPGDVIYFTGRWNDAPDQLPEGYTLIAQGDIWCKVKEC